MDTVRVGNVIAYAKWIPLGYTVVVNTSDDEAGLVSVSGGQAVKESAQQYEIGDVIVCAVVTGGEEEYYDFLGWYMDGEKVSSSAEYAYTVTDDVVVTVTAVWKGVTRTALFYSNRSADDREFVSVSYDYGSYLEYTPDPRGLFGRSLYRGRRHFRKTQNTERNVQLLCQMGQYRNSFRDKEDRG